MAKDLSLIIPTLNEGDNIASLVQRVDGALGSRDYEIVFVDDNSKDNTAGIIKNLSSRYPVSVIVRKQKKGLASAVIDGMEKAEGKTIGVMDADLQHPPEVLPSLLAKIEEGADMVVASRYVEGGAASPDWSRLRRIISKGAILLSHVLLPTTRHVKDPVSGFFVFDKRIAAGTDLRPTGYKILLELLVQGKCRRVAEVPYTFGIRGGGQSKLSARQQLYYLKHLYSLMRRTGETNRFIKFCLVGLSGVFVNMGLLWLLTEIAGIKYFLSAAVSIESSIISNFLLNNVFTFGDRRSPGRGETLRRLLKFNLVSLTGLAINMAILVFLTEVIGIYYLISHAFGIAAAALWNYILSTWWTWKY